MMDKLEEAALVAAIERDTGAHVVEVQHYTVLPPILGATCACGNSIEMFICVQWCDECWEAFELTKDTDDPFKGPQDRWRANGWKPHGESA